jgi:hypothetical protein
LRERRFDSGVQGCSIKARGRFRSIHSERTAPKHQIRSNQQRSQTRIPIQHCTNPH